MHQRKSAREVGGSHCILAKIFPNFGPLNEYGAMLRTTIEPLPYRYISIELEEVAGLYPEAHRFEDLLTLALRGFDNPDAIRFQCDAVTLEFSGAEGSIEAMPGDEDDEEWMEELKELNSGDTAAASEKITIDGFTANSHAEVLERLSSLRPGVPLPPVRMYLDDLKHTDDESWNFTRVLGTGRHGSMGYGREVPWEKEDADFGWEFKTFDDEDER